MLPSKINNSGEKQLQSISCSVLEPCLCKASTGRNITGFTSAMTKNASRNCGQLRGSYTRQQQQEQWLMQNWTCNLFVVCLYSVEMRPHLSLVNPVLSSLSSIKKRELFSDQQPVCNPSRSWLGVEMDTRARRFLRAHCAFYTLSYRFSVAEVVLDLYI